MSTDANFKSKDFAVRAQKKILGQFSSRKAAKVFINENLATLLDLLYQLMKSHTQDKKVAEKFVKNIIKLSIKIGVLAQNDQFSQEEIRIANKFADMFRNTAMTIASFIEVDFSYDRNVLIKTVNDCESQLKLLVKNHLTDKSVSRLQSVANHLRDPTLLDAAFKKGTPQNEIMIQMVNEINKAIENGDL
ncbi:unnamed protein product [Orchesella dallaii]|uniref:Tumor necrosis factor alpha-induced protein 8-like protein n=1 Tax=Orchesella dallaii TaxID=48710 RepID=A0ABP1Q225_9HEXA